MNIKGSKAIALLLALAAAAPIGAPSGGGAPLGGSGEARACSAICDGESAEAVRISSEAPSDEGDAGVVIGSRIWELLSGRGRGSSDRPQLIVGGGVFGTRIKDARVCVSSVEDGCPLKEGDRIISVNGREIRSISDVREELRRSEGEALELVCQRNSRSVSIKCTPRSVSGEYRLGAVLREGAAGIGTVTYIDPASGEFGGLGHGICDPDSGEVIQMTGGTVTAVILGGVVKGEVGKPGELSGILTDRPMGEIYANTECGVFGRLSAAPRGTEAKLMPIAYRSEVKPGDATIISTLKNGATMSYKVELSDVKPADNGSKSFKLKVTDPALLAISGGIVRGMSGSPIIQDGKLVGAVTHVLINDPTSGYGIFIENMLNASESARNELPRAA